MHSCAVTPANCCLQIETAPAPCLPCLRDTQSRDCQEQGPPGAWTGARHKTAPRAQGGGDVRQPVPGVSEIHSASKLTITFFFLLFQK